MSFAALTNSGVGHIIAVWSAARSLAALEQIDGIFFIAILIARLAGVYPPEPKQPSAAARGTRAPRLKVKR